MNSITQQVIEFLSHPELNFGGEEDLLLLTSPDALRGRVASLLEQSSELLGASSTQELQAHLSQVEWDLVAREFETRVQMAARFFDGDAQADKSP